MTSPGVVYVDEDDGSYDRLRLPRNWSIHREPRWLSLQGSMQWCYQRFPDATQYGWLADDTRPRTRGWDKQLEAAAGEWRLAYANDLWYSLNPGEREQLERGHNLSSGLCWGGELVRAVGWWALPGVIQAGIDTAWTDLVRPLGLHCYRHDIVVEHLNWRTKKRPYDDTDLWERPDAGDYIDKDLVAKDRWFRSVEYRNLISVLASAAPLTESEIGKALAQSRAEEELDINIARDRARAGRQAFALNARRQSLVDELWSAGGIPAARIDRIMEGGNDDVLEAEIHRHHTNKRQARLAAQVHPERP